MKHIYTITGMTCNGCKTSVEDKLNAVNGVIHANVDLEKAEAVIEMASHIPIKEIQSHLPSKYTITEKANFNVFNENINYQEQEKSDLKQLFPLLLIFIYITITSILLNYSPWNSSGFMLDFMGLFYIIFSFFKFLDLKGFPDSFQMYDPLAKLIPIYGWIYPFIELTLGIMFLMRFQIPLVLFITIVILGITTFGVTKALLDKKAIQCACLGTALKLPMTKATFIENTIMLIMAISMLLKIYEL